MKYFAILALSIMLISCNEEEYDANFTVQNDVSGTTITQIYFSSNYIGSYLLPGQTSTSKFYGYEEEWPKTGNISFVMQANQKQVYLVTKAQYTLNANDNLTVVISDTTEVMNP